MNNKNTYNLFVKERRFRNNTFVSYYFRPNKQISKTCSPIDVNGERLQVNHLTGEVNNYKKKTIFENRDASIRRSKILLNMLLEMNDFDWFWTLTFDKDKINREDPVAVFHCYEKYINNLRHKYPLFAYICVPELHEKGCYHFHLLVKGLSVSDMGLTNSGKVCCSWSPKNGVASLDFYERTKHLYTLVAKETDGQPIYNITTFAYGFTTASRIVSRAKCNSYIKKYIKKSFDSRALEENYRKRFFYGGNLNVPDVVTRLVGSDFKNPKQAIDTLDAVVSDPLYQNSFQRALNTEHNVLQCRVENQVVDYIDRGIIPLIDNFNLDLEEIF